MNTVAKEGESTFLHMIGKAARYLREHGPIDTLRGVIWRWHYSRFQRLRRNGASRRNHAPSVVRFLDHDFELHPSLQGVSEELVLYGVHEPVATRLYLKTLSPGDHVIDVGSNIGYWLLLAASRIGESGRILGFEPVPGSREILQRNIQRSGISNVELSPWAIGGETGAAQFYESQVPNWGSLVKHDDLLPTRNLPVEVKKLDEVAMESTGFRPKMLRMDVEGAELMVLAGARNLLEKYKPSLFIEFHPFLLGWDAVRRTLAGLMELGYTSGTMIDRTWDQPWISKWMRERRCWRGPIDILIRRVESPKDPLIQSTLTMILMR
jgi:FkbM family methyltransferase